MFKKVMKAVVSFIFGTTAEASCQPIEEPIVYRPTIIYRAADLERSKPEETAAPKMSWAEYTANNQRVNKYFNQQMAA